MLNSISIIVRPPASHPDSLKVQDAMQQVFDFFELLVTGTPESDDVYWRLSAVSMGSPPLQVTAEATSVRAGADINSIVGLQKDRLQIGLRALARGAVPAEWSTGRPKKKVQELLRRNQNGIGRTDVLFDDSPEPVVQMTPQMAKVALSAYQAAESPFELLGDNRSRMEIGSVEGYLIEVTTHYNQPAIRIRERLTNKEFLCRISRSDEEKIAGAASFVDVWEGRRVIVGGTISYDEAGAIRRVDADVVTRISGERMSLSDIADPRFTGGLSSAEYLSRLGEGEVG